MRRLYKLDRMGQEYEQPSERHVVEQVDDADIVSSESTLVEGMHYPTLDIDLPCRLVPSETEGHFHFFIDTPVEWWRYERLLEALEECGIIETGYLNASKGRGFTAVAVRPWKDRGSE